MANNFQIQELDFDTIKANLIGYLKTQDSFKDYDYEASGMSVLLDTLAYNTHYNALMVNYMANEMFIDSAQRRDNTVSHAKGYGYVPRGNRAPYALINITVNSAVGEPDSLTLYPGVTFETVVNDVIYQYVVRDTLVAYKSLSGTYVFSDVKVYEGDLLRKTVIADGSTGYYITLDNTGIDSSLIRVMSMASVNDVTYASWQSVDSIINVAGDSQVYFLEETFDGKYKIIFGDGTVGKRVGANEVFEVTYQRTSGSISNGAAKFTLTGNIEGNSNVSVTTSVRSTSGSDAESLDEIKLNAVNYYRTQNRAVTAADYRSLIKKYGINVKDAITWGGETESPPRFGKVFACVIPVFGDALTSDEYAGIKSVIADRCVANTVLEFQKPSYLDIGITSRISYNPLYLTTSSSSLKSNVLDGIVTKLSSLENFSTKFTYSSLIGYIDTIDQSIIGNETTISLIRETQPVLGLISPIELSFATTISNFVSSAFKTNDNQSDQIFKVYSSGIIARTTVAGAVIDTNAGTIDLVTGDIKIKPVFISSYTGDFLKFYAAPVKNDIYSKNNIILRVKDTNVSITTVAESK